MLGALFGLFAGMARGAGDDPLQAQKNFAREQEWKAAAAAMHKTGVDMRNGIAAGVMDSSSKSMNATFAAAKAISY